MYNFLVIYITSSLIITALMNLTMDKVDKISLEIGFAEIIKKTEFKHLVLIFILSLIPIINVIFLGMSIFALLVPKNILIQALQEFKNK